MSILNSSRELRGRETKLTRSRADSRQRETRNLIPIGRTRSRADSRQRETRNLIPICRTEQ